MISCRFYFLILFYLVFSQPLRFKPLDLDPDDPTVATHVPIGSRTMKVGDKEVDTEFHTLIRGGTEIKGKKFGMVYDMDGNSNFVLLVFTFAIAFCQEISLVSFIGQPILVA